MSSDCRKKLNSNIKILFCTSGAFAAGSAEGVIEEALQPISAIRLVFQSEAAAWALLNEVCSAYVRVCFPSFGSKAPYTKTCSCLSDIH